MANGNQDPEGAIDFEDFRGWVKETAAVQDTSDQAILEQLVSTYWILRELSETLEGTEYEDVLDPSTGEPSAESERQWSAPELLELLDQVDEEQATEPEPRPYRSSGVVDPSLIQLIDTLQRTGGQDSRRAASTGGESPALSEIKESLASIEAQVEAGTTSGEDRDSETVRKLDRHQDAIAEVTNERFEELDRRLEQVYGELSEAVNDALGTADATIDDLERLRTEVDDLRADFEHEIEAVDRTLTELEDRLDATRADLTGIERAHKQLAGQFENHASETTDRFTELRDTVRTNTSEVEHHLEGLYESVSEQEEAREAVIESLEDRLGAAMIAKRDREDLRELTTRAHEEGIETAECSNCGNPVSLGLLDRPQCPHCDRRFTDLDSQRFLWRQRHRLRARSPADETSRPSRPDEREEEAAAEPAEDPTPPPDPEAELEPATDESRSLNWLRR